MDKHGLDRVEDLQQRLMLSKIIDTANAAGKESQPKFSNFLDSASLNLVQSLHFDVDLTVKYWGGYEQAERKIICIYPNWYNSDDADIPLVTIKASGRMTEGLTHRDYLGALMGLGIKRETIGDILIEGSCAFIFCKKEISGYILNNFDKVGRHGVELEIADNNDIILPEVEQKVISIPVVSMRLDAIISSALNISRSKSSELINAGLVNVNHKECKEQSMMLTVGDLISIRKFGRLKIGEITGKSRKGRTYLEIIMFS